MTMTMPMMTRTMSERVMSPGGASPFQSYSPALQESGFASTATRRNDTTGSSFPPNGSGSTYNPDMTTPIAEILRDSLAFSRPSLIGSGTMLPETSAKWMTKTQRDKPLAAAYLLPSIADHPSTWERPSDIKGHPPFSEPEPVGPKTVSERRMAARMMMLDRTLYSPRADGKPSFNLKATDSSASQRIFSRFKSEGEFLHAKDSAALKGLEDRFWQNASETGALRKRDLMGPRRSASPGRRSRSPNRRNR